MKSQATKRGDRGHSSNRLSHELVVNEKCTQTKNARYFNSYDGSKKSAFLLQPNDFILVSVLLVFLFFSLSPYFYVADIRLGTQPIWLQVYLLLRLPPPVFLDLQRDTRRIRRTSGVHTLWLC